jgi:hypothetical protein
MIQGLFGTYQGPGTCIARKGRLPRGDTHGEDDSWLLRPCILDRMLVPWAERQGLPWIYAIH